MQELDYESTQLAVQKQELEDPESSGLCLLEQARAPLFADPTLEVEMPAVPELTKGKQTPGQTEEVQ